MNQITIRYGVDSHTKTFSVPPTMDAILQDDNLAAVFGWGDNIRGLISGVEVAGNAIVPFGSVVFVETRCNEKA